MVVKNACGTCKFNFWCRHFLGGLSLHLNHLIGSRMRISYRLFGTLPIGIFFSNLGSGQLMTCPRTLFGQIWHMSLFGDSRAIRVLMSKYRPFRKSIFSRWRSSASFSRLGGCRWADGWAIWWYHFRGGGVRHTWGLWQRFESEGSVFWWFFDTFASA